MSAKWMRVETDFVDHPKVMRLARHLKVDEATAGWAVMRAWSWMSRFCPVGQLRDIDRDTLEDACKWRGEPGALLAGLVAVGFFEESSDGNLEAHDWTEHQGKVASNAAKERERKRAYRARLAEMSRGTSRGTRDGTETGRPAQRDVTGRDVTEGAGAVAPPQLELVSPKPKAKPPPKPPDPEAEFARFVNALTPDEAAVFEAYETHMGVRLGADWGLRKFVTGKLKAHHAAELCAAIKGHASDPWRRENQPSLRAILRDASVIAAAAKAGAA